MPRKDKKPDAIKIEAFWNSLTEETWLGAVRSRWVKYLFHYTDIRNAVEILKNNKLICRAELERNNSMLVDNASRIVMSKTELEVKNFVRLYFRPKTPTQYNNEGIRPKAQQSLESHCPVPVFFLFDAKTILVRADYQFAEGNLARLGTQGLCSTAEELSNFDFKKIYHLGSFSQTERDDIISHRNAEIVIRNELDLLDLKFIVCRSPAEKESVLHLLPANIFSKWSSKILVDTKAHLYNRNWVFIQTAQLSSSYVIFDFSPDATVATPFVLTITFKSDGQITQKQENFSANQRLSLKFPNDVMSYEIELKLDDNLVFTGRFDGSENIPF